MKKYFKSIIIVIIAILLPIIVACGDDSVSLVGSWKTEWETTWEFFSDGTLIDGRSELSTWTADGNRLLIRYRRGSSGKNPWYDNTTATFKISGGTLTLTFDPESGSAQAYMGRVPDDGIFTFKKIK